MKKINATLLMIGLLFVSAISTPSPAQAAEPEVMWITTPENGLRADLIGAVALFEDDHRAKGVIRVNAGDPRDATSFELFFARIVPANDKRYQNLVIEEGGRTIINFPAGCDMMFVRKKLELIFKVSGNGVVTFRAGAYSAPVN